MDVDPVFAHEFLNHIPVIGGIGALLLLAWGLCRRSEDVTLAALSAFVVVGLMGVVAFATGVRVPLNASDPATTTLLHEHHDAAMAALVGLGAASMVAVCALILWFTSRRYPTYAAVATLIVGLAATILVVRAAALGGRFSHTMLRANAVAKR